MIKQNQKILNGVLVFSDWLCVCASLILAYIIRFSYFEHEPAYLGMQYYYLLLLFLIPVFTFLFGETGLYSSRRSKTLVQELLAVVKADSITAIALLTLLYLMKLSDYSRLCLLIFFMLVPVAVGLERMAVRGVLHVLRAKGYNQKYILLIGDGRTARQFADKVGKNANYGYRFYGRVTDRPEAAPFGGAPVVGNMLSLSAHLASGHVDEVFVAIELKEYDKLPHLIAVCEKCGVKINIVPSYFQYIPSRPLLDEFDGMPVMTLRKIPLSNRLYAFAKRLLDIVMAIICLVLFSPIILITSLIIAITMRESPIYWHERIGLDCKPFVMYKFRSMRSIQVAQGHAPDRTSWANWANWTKKKDERRTRFGAFIRKFSIDEIPQFFNVLKGDMSVVGPRPEVQCYVEQFRESIPRYMVKHQVKPGITGWAQVNGLRGDTSIEQRIRSDLYYIENWSFLLDIRIILRTIGRAFYNENE